MPQFFTTMSSSTILASLSHLTLSSIRSSTRIPCLLALQQQIRAASHASQGVANGAKQGPGKRLGAKKGQSELVVPGNIIFRQRGTHWYAGENCVMGRDHTISALVKGYVRYYRDPDRHKTRKFIGVVLQQRDELPRPASMPRRRRLGMEARVAADTVGAPSIVAAVAVEEGAVGNMADAADNVQADVKQAIKIGVGRRLKMNPEADVAIRGGYQVRESNWSIGRTAEMEYVKVRQFNPKDRWLVWRQRAAEKAKKAETMVQTRGGKSKRSKKGKTKL